MKLPVASYGESQVEVAIEYQGSSLKEDIRPLWYQRQLLCCVFTKRLLTT